jgi:aromatase
MSGKESYAVEHSGVVRAPAATIYRLIADLTAWPRVFPNILHAEPLHSEGNRERAAIWLVSGDDVRRWVALRTLSPDELRVSYRQENAQHPVADMGGAWVVEPRGDSESLVRLQHDYRPAVTDASTLEWIAETLDRNSAAELAALTAGAEREVQPDLHMSWEDTVSIAGDASAAYEFLRDAQGWDAHVGHVLASSAREAGPDAQLVELAMPDKDGNRHVARQVRVCFEPARIIYKQLVIPPMAASHTGTWLVEKTADGVIATARQTVVFSKDGIAAVLGAGAGIADARNFARTGLSANARAILTAAKAHAENRG